MTTDPIFGAAPHASPSVLVCFTRDGKRHDLPGPMNMPSDMRHREIMRFAPCHGMHLVTFQARGDHMIEIASERFR